MTHPLSARTLTRIAVIAFCVALGGAAAALVGVIQAAPALVTISVLISFFAANIARAALADRRAVQRGHGPHSPDHIA